MPGLTNEYVSKIGKSVIGPSFLGVYACDEEPSIKNKNNFKLIFNTGTHDSNGEHFVAVARQNKKLYYFDPLGQNVNNVFILNFLKKTLTEKKYFFNSVQIQDDQSISCGFFCIAYLISIKKKISMRKFISNFFIRKDKLLLNDKKSVNFIVKNLK